MHGSSLKKSTPFNKLIGSNFKSSSKHKSSKDFKKKSGFSNSSFHGQGSSSKSVKHSKHPDIQKKAIQSQSIVKNEAGEGSTFDMEQQFILRMPPDVADDLQAYIHTGVSGVKDKLQIEMQLETRRGKVWYGDRCFNAKLLDLPTIIESLKTTDRKTLYKTADISQILICTEGDSADEADSPHKKIKEEKRFLYNHGITPPLKNVRKRRFRKTLKKKQYTEQPDIEKEVKRLFRADNEAIDVKWEIVYDDDDAKKGGVTIEGGEDSLSRNPSSGNLAEHIFGQVSSSDEDDVEQKEINIMDSDDEEGGISQEPGTPAGQSMPGMNLDDDESMPPISENIDNSDIKSKIDELAVELQEIQEQKRLQEEEMESIDNMALRQRFQSILDDLTEKEVEKSRELDFLERLLSHSGGI